MENTPSPFSALLIVIFLAFLVPIVLTRFRRLRLPIVVGEILAGILIGRSGFGLVSPDEPILAFMADFGFVFLMFLSGLEIDFSSLGIAAGNGLPQQTERRGPLPVALLSFALTLALAAGISFGLAEMGLARNPWLMGLILSTTSLGVVVPVLKERGLIGGRFGQTVLFAALIADFATMFLITVMVTLLSQELTFNILLVGLLFVAFFIVLRFGRLFNRLPGARRLFSELGHTTAQIKIRAAFTIMLVFVVLSELLGTEVILGAFLAGAAIALLMIPDDANVPRELETIGYGFLVPIFFIKVGIDFNINALLASPQAMLLVPLLIVAAILVKVLPALVFRLGFSWRETFAAGALLSARLSLIIAAASVGVQLGVISEATNAAILLVAILTVTLAPVAFTLIAPAATGPERTVAVVAGAGALGLQVAERLRAHNEKVVIVSEAVELVARARERGYEARIADLERADPRATDLLERASALVCTYESADRNYAIAQVARSTYGLKHIVAQVNTPADLDRFAALGVSTINAALDQAALLAMLARNPATYALLTRTDDNKEVYEVLVENPDCIGRTIRELRLPGDTLALAVRRDGELLVPHGNTRLEAGDHLTLVSSLEWVELGRLTFARRS